MPSVIHPFQQFSGMKGSLVYVAEILPICSLPMIIDALSEEKQELEALVESLDKTCTRYKMEMSV